MKPIYVLARYCHFSKISEHKARPDYFSYELCFHNLKRTLNRDLAELTCLFDGDPQGHFISEQDDFPVVSAQLGSGPKSYRWALDYVLKQGLPDDTIIYLLEDDYLHVQGWCEILLEGFQIPGVEYVTLYDHCDKYNPQIYAQLTSQILISPHCHWRSTPSTTDTFAVRLGTLKRDMDIHLASADEQKLHTQDHARFVKLWEKGSNLISCIPAYSTHMAEPEVVAPIRDWRALAALDSDISS